MQNPDPQWNEEDNFQDAEALPEQQQQHQQQQDQQQQEQQPPQVLNPELRERAIAMADQILNDLVGRIQVLET